MTRPTTPRKTRHHPEKEGKQTNSPFLGRKPPKGMVQGETSAQGPNLSPSSVAHTAGLCTVPEQTRGTAVPSSGTRAHGPDFEASYSLIHTKKPSTSLQQKSEYISSSAEKLHWRAAAAPPWDRAPEPARGNQHHACVSIFCRWKFSKPREMTAKKARGTTAGCPPLRPYPPRLRLRLRDGSV